MKKFGRIISLFLLAGLFSVALVGCSNWSGIPNSKSDQIIFNGGIISVVDDNLFYANGYVDGEITTMDEYNAAAEYSYLARLNTNEGTSAYSSPENVNKLNSEVLGYENAYSFVLGDYVYYASPNKHRTSSNEHVFTYVSIFKTRLNGADTAELMTTSSFDSATAEFRAVQTQGQSYLLVFDGTALSSINLSNDEVSKISSAATSVALPREGESFDGKVYFTEDKDNSYGQSGNEVFEYNLLTGEKNAIMKTINNTITFTGRVGDELFFTRLNETTQVSRTYRLDTQRLVSAAFLSAAESFYSAEIDNVFRIESNTASGYNGYVFTSSLSGEAQLLYRRDSDSSTVRLAASDEFSSILFVNKDFVFFSTESGISYKSVMTPSETTTLVSDMTIISTKIGYERFESGNLKNIYFYAQRVYEETDEVTDETTDAEEETDTNYYLYKLSFTAQTTPQLLSKTVV